MTYKVLATGEQFNNHIDAVTAAKLAGVKFIARSDSRIIQVPETTHDVIVFEKRQSRYEARQ